MKRFPFIVLVLICLGCSPEELPQQNFEIKVINGLTGEPISDAQVSLYYEIGCTYSLDFDEGMTDINGNVSLQTQVDMDSVSTLLGADEFLAERHVNQSVFIEKEGFVFYEIVQDTAQRVHRPKVNEEQLAIAKMYEHIPANLRFIDQAPRRDRDLIFQYDIRRFHPAFSFELLGSGLEVLNLESGDVLDIPLSLADQVDFRVDFYLAEYDTLSERLDTIYHDFVNLTGQKSVQDLNMEIAF